MRVLMITERFPPQPGGVGVSARRNARNVAGKLARLDVLHLDESVAPGAVEAREDEGFTVYAAGPLPGQEAETLQVLELVARGLLARHRHDLVHGFYAVPAGTVAVMAARLLELPCLVSVRGNDLDRDLYHRRHSSLLQWTLRYAHRILCVSREAEQRARLVGARSTEYTPNAVDPELFFPEPGSPGQPPMVLFTGEMRFKKGLVPLLQAVEGRELRLVLAGGVRKRDRAWLRGAAVEVRPYVDDPVALRGLYNQADLVVCPSLWDGMPNTVLEAMACGRPVLATRVGGIGDLVTHGESGWLLDPWDLDALGDHLDEVLALPVEDRRRVGEAARRAVLEAHRPEHEAQRLLAAYRATASTS